MTRLRVSFEAADSRPRGTLCVQVTLRDGEPVERPILLSLAAQLLWGPRSRPQIEESPETPGVFWVNMLNRFGEPRRVGPLRAVIENVLPIINPVEDVEA